MLSRRSAVLEFQLGHFHDENKVLESRTSSIVLENNLYKTQNIKKQKQLKDTEGDLRTTNLVVGNYILEQI